MELFTQVAGAVAALLFFVAIAFFVALHAAERGLSLTASAVSEFANGRTASLFVVYGIIGSVAALVLGMATYGNGAFPLRVSIYLLALAALRVGVLVFRTDADGRAATTAGRLHLVFAVATFALMYMALAAAVPPVRQLTLPWVATVIEACSWIAAAGLAGLVGCMVLRFRKAFGLFERVFLLASLIGLGLVAFAIAMAA